MGLLYRKEQKRVSSDHSESLPWLLLLFSLLPCVVLGTVHFLCLLQPFGFCLACHLRNILATVQQIFSVLRPGNKGNQCVIFQRCLGLMGLGFHLLQEPWKGDTHFNPCCSSTLSHHPDSSGTHSHLSFFMMEIKCPKTSRGARLGPYMQETLRN